MIENLFINGEVYRNGTFEKTNVGTENGKIIYIGSEQPEASNVVDCVGLNIFPGIIDTQVHFRDPGANHKEDLETGSKAAALGGVTTFFDMPNTAPSTQIKRS